MKKRKIEVPLQNGKELKPIMIKPNMGKIIKPMMERDPFPKREQKRMIKLTPAQRKKERSEKAHFGIHVANVAALRGLGGGLRGAKAASRSRNVTANPFKSADAQLLKKYPTGSQLHKFHKDQAKHFAKQFKKPMAKFPDLSGDGKVTQKDILIGKGVIDKPKMDHGKKPKMYNKPKMKKGKHSLGKDVVAEYAKKGISEKILNTFGTTSSDTVTVKSRNHRGINPRAGAALKLSGKKSGTVKGLYSSGKEIMTRGQGKKEKIAYAMGDRTYTQDNKKELAGKVMMYKSKPKMYNKPKYYGKKKK